MLGKSSLLQVLFRLRELNGGRILIDGIDISTLPLHRLRRSMAIITQTPTLFTGTIRSNLLEGQGVDDDDEEKDGGENKTTITDEEMWKALRQCNMEQKVRDMELGSVAHCCILEESLHCDVCDWILISLSVCLPPPLLGLF